MYKQIKYNKKIHYFFVFVKICNRSKIFMAYITIVWFFTFKKNLIK